MPHQGEHVTSCICCWIWFGRSELWHIHPRCPWHGRLQYRDLPMPPGTHYGGCLRDHAIVGLHIVPCKVNVDW
jgi:hypothetical protein